MSSAIKLYQGRFGRVALLTDSTAVLITHGDREELLRRLAV